MPKEILSCAKYSVLMSVYGGADPNQLQEALSSMLCQTLPTDDLVLVCDGPLTPELNRVIHTTAAGFPDTIRVLRRSRHEGLVAALNAGLGLCRHELIARMDSDDISLPHRCRTQVQYLTDHPQLSILSSDVQEFMDVPGRMTGKRALPSGHGDILRFSKTRSPFNHPAVMYRKSAVEALGGYRPDYPLFEDYDLWVRMLRFGFRGENLREPLLFMRTGRELYRRRGGARYAGSLLWFQLSLCLTGWSSPLDFMVSTLPHAAVCLFPTDGLRLVYRWLHRKGGRRGYPYFDRRHRSLQPVSYLTGL